MQRSRSWAETTDSQRHPALRYGSTQHTCYGCSQRLICFMRHKENLPMAQEVPRKNTGKSIKTIQRVFMWSKDHREQLYSRSQWYKVLCIYGRAWDLSWTFNSTMTTKNRPPGYTCLWHTKFPKFYYKCIWNIWSKKNAKLDPHFP